jgi:hypothetical protein
VNTVLLPRGQRSAGECQLSRWLAKQDYLLDKNCFAFAKSESIVAMQRHFCAHLGMQRAVSLNTIHMFT